MYLDDFFFLERVYTSVFASLDTSAPHSNFSASSSPGEIRPDLQDRKMTGEVMQTDKNTTTISQNMLISQFEQTTHTNRLTYMYVQHLHQEHMSPRRQRERMST